MSPQRNELLLGFVDHVGILRQDMRGLEEVARLWPAQSRAHSALKKLVRDVQQLEAHALAMMAEVGQMDKARRHLTGEATFETTQRSSGVLPRPITPPPHVAHAPETRSQSEGYEVVPPEPDAPLQHHAASQVPAGDNADERVPDSHSVDANVRGLPPELLEQLRQAGMH